MRERKATDLVTVREALCAGSAALVCRCLKQADRQTKLESLAIVAGHSAMVAFHDVTTVLRTLFTLIPRLGTDEIQSACGTPVKAALAGAMAMGNIIAFNEIFDHVLPESDVPIGWVQELLEVASSQYRLEEFRRILTIPTAWGVSDGYAILSNLTLSTQGPKGIVLGIANSLLSHLDKLGLVTEVVNYHIPGRGCEPNCENTHGHTFHESLFSMWTRSGLYEFAKLLAPHVDGLSRRPAALWHILNNPDAHVLDHIEFLMESGKTHRRYVVFPPNDKTVLQQACLQHG